MDCIYDTLKVNIFYDKDKLGDKNSIRQTKKPNIGDNMEVNQY